LRYTFTLRDDLRWSNGDKVTADDFVFGMKRALTPEIGLPFVTFYKGIRNALAYQSGEITDFSEVGISASDAQTLVFELEEPTLFLLSVLNGGFFYPLHQESVEAAGAATNPRTDYFRPGTLIGNGPFKLESWQPNQIVRVTRNEHFHTPARLAAIEFLPIESADTDVRSFRAGQHHKTATIPNPLLEVLDPSDPEVYSAPVFGVYFYIFNTEKPPLDDPRVRRALTLAIDRQSITRDILHGWRDPAYSFIPPGASGYQPAYTFEADVAEARRLLADAGFPGGRGFPELEILYNTLESHRVVAEAIQQMWKRALGIDVGLFNQEWKVYLDSQSSGDFMISRAAWVAGTDPQGYLDLFVSGSGNNHSNFAHPEFDALFDAARRELNPERRLERFQEAERYILEQLPVAPIFFYRTEYFLDPRVTNWPASPTDNRPQHLIGFAVD
jgi:oligopeptide transport system substrate-binding protein